MIYGFAEAYDSIYKEIKKYGGYDQHPLFKTLHTIHLKNVKEINYEAEHTGGFNIEGKAAKNETEMIHVTPTTEPAVETAAEVKKSEDDDLIQKRQRTCDEIFAEYLDFVSRKVKKEYYMRVMKFVFLLRECVNTYSDKLKEARKSLPADLFPEIKVPQGTADEYCLTNNAEQVPDLSNDFIMNYLTEKEITDISTPNAIDLTQNVCHWLFINSYTCSKLSLIQ